MSIDKRIQQALKEDANNIQQSLQNEQGLFEMIGQTFKGGLKRWVILVNIVTLLVTAVLIGCGYQFFIAATQFELTFWGVCFIAALIAQIALKQWLFQEIYRNNILREIKRLEIEILQLRNN